MHIVLHLYCRVYYDGWHGSVHVISQQCQHNLPVGISRVNCMHMNGYICRMYLQYTSMCNTAYSMHVHYA